MQEIRWIPRNARKASRRKMEKVSRPTQERRYRLIKAKAILSNADGNSLPRHAAIPLIVQTTARQIRNLGQKPKSVKFIGVPESRGFRVFLSEAEFK